MGAAGGPLGPAKAEGGPGRQDELGLPRLPGFREMALGRMAGERRRLVGELTAQRQAAGLSQTQVAARMGTSQSAVARLEAGGADVRASTLERYAAAIGTEISWRLQDPPPAAEQPAAWPDPGPGRGPGPGPMPGPAAPAWPLSAPGPRPAPGPIAPAAQHRPYGQRQEDSHGRSRG